VAQVLRGGEPMIWRDLKEPAVADSVARLSEALYGLGLRRGDRVAVLKDGILQQVDTPRRMYDHPNNVFVAGFIGSPAMNLLTIPLDGNTLKFGAGAADAKK